MRRLISILLILLVLLEGAGCAAFQKKFTRKRKEKEKPRPVLNLDDEKYKDLYTPEFLYEEFFVYWQASESELINLLSTGSRFAGVHSHKREVMTVEMTMVNLKGMQEQLREDKKELLDGEIKELEEVNQALQDKAKSAAKLARVTRDLENHFRRIRKEFHPSKMAELIKAKQ